MAEKTEDKRRRILGAATTLFARHGWKRTSVDLLAAEAGVAKPTIYAYFEDKEAIFRAVAEAVCAEMREAAEEAASTKGSLEERVSGLLSAKFTRYWELVQTSPHAEELIGSQNRVAAEAVARHDKAFAELLTNVLAEATEQGEIDPAPLGLSPKRLAELLLRAGSGAAYDATSVAGHRRHLAEIVRAVLAGVRT